jgi:predicted small secreted protein
MKTLLIMLAAASFTLSACNTMQGFGKDVEKVGSKIEEKAKK